MRIGTQTSKTRRKHVRKWCPTGHIVESEKSARMIRRVASLHRAGVAVSAPPRRTSARAGARDLFGRALRVRMMFEQGERGSAVAASRATHLPPDAGGVAIWKNAAGKVNKDAGLARIFAPDVRGDPRPPSPLASTVRYLRMGVTRLPDARAGRARLGRGSKSRDTFATRRGIVTSDKIQRGR